MALSPSGLCPELPYLEVFRTVCDEEGFTAAAKKLGNTQPAVSYQIRRLEQILGVTLIERTGRQFVLTPEGRRFRLFADQVFQGLARVRNECIAGQELDPLRLGSASGFGRYVLVPALHALRQEQPVEIRLQYEAADVLMDRLETGAYEGAFVYKRRVSNTLRYEPAYDEELVLIGSAARSADARRRGLGTLETCEHLPFVTYEECDYVFGRWFDASFGTQPSRLTSRAHFTELEEVIDFVTRGVGLSIVPRDSAEAACQRGELEILYAGSGLPCYNQVFLVARASSEPRPVVRRLLQLLGASGA